MTFEVERPRLLRRWLRANSAFSALSGSALLVFSGSLPGLLGIGGRWVYVAIGVGLVLYAGHLWRVAGRPVERAEILGIIVGDVAWVLGSVVLVAFWTLSTAGVWIVTGVAVVIAFFAVMQWRGLKRADALPAPASS